MANTSTTASKISRNMEYVSKSSIPENKLPWKCKFCGAKLPEPAILEAVKCTGTGEESGCGEITFVNPLPVGTLIQPVIGRDGRVGILLCRRAIAPAIGKCAVPGGYLEFEDWRRGVAREGNEELNLGIDGWEAIKPIHIGNSTDGLWKIIIFGMAQPIFEDDLPPFIPNSEVSERRIAWAPEELPFSSHQEAMNLFFKEHARSIQLRYLLKNPSLALRYLARVFRPRFR